VKTLVATDIAARGIDVDGISHVVNFDLPNIPETYVHRIGRTARAGADGIAISLCDREELAFLRDIEKLIGKSIPSDNRPRANGSTANDHHQAGRRHAPRPAAPRRGHEDSAAPARGAREQAGDGPRGIAAVTFMRNGTGSRGAGTQATPNWGAGRKKSRRGRGRPAAF
jgi:ATP-dependent RNA helicase RhlE